MSFPLSPTNGQQANINGVTYVYSSTLTAWTVSTGYGDTFLNISVTDTVNSGNLLATGIASVSGNITGGNLSAVNLVINSISSDDSTFITIEDGVSVIGQIFATDNITAYFSDRRLKDITGTIPDAISKVMSLSGVQFTNNDRAAEFGYTSQHAQVGVIAQEVQRVLPEAVVPAPFDIATDDHGVEISRTGQNYLTVQYEKIIPLLIEAIKQQQFMIQELQQRMD